MKIKNKNIENNLPIVILIVIVAVLAIVLTAGGALFSAGIIGKELPEEVTSVTSIKGVTVSVDHSKNSEGRNVYTYTVKDKTIKEFLTEYKIEKYTVNGMEITEENGIEKINVSDDKIEIVTPRQNEYPDLTHTSITFKNYEDNKVEKLDFYLLVED